MNICFTDYLIQPLHFMEVKLEAERGAQGLLMAKTGRFHNR